MINTYAIPRSGLKNSKTVENASSPPAEAPKQTIGKGLVGGDVCATTFLIATFLEITVVDLELCCFSLTMTVIGS